ncbi:hypothetical protein AQJ27_18860 [Streptomyces olivochromogenes]|nr:hypothetical protein AQJ27_18860 [Streptomyces olivochromogenes]
MESATAGSPICRNSYGRERAHRALGGFRDLCALATSVTPFTPFTPFILITPFTPFILITPFTPFTPFITPFTPFDPRGPRTGGCHAEHPALPEPPSRARRLGEAAR